MKCIALLLLVGVAGAAAQGTTKQTLIEAVKNNPKLSMLASSIESSHEIVEALGDFSGTVFAPNDDAFKAALAAATELGIASTVMEKLPYILRYHLVPGTPVFSGDLADGEKLVTADNGKELTVAFEDGKAIIKAIGSEAGILTPDIKIGDDVAVHIIDTVLLPMLLPTGAPAPVPAPEAAPGPVPAPTNTMRAIYDSVVDAAKAEGLDNLLAALEASDLAGAFGPEFNGTVFAPTNAALETFLDEASIDLDAMTEEQLQALTDILTYHVVPSVAATSADLTNNQILETLNGVPITVLVRPKGVVIEDAAGNKYDVTVANIIAGDAVVHVIDGVLVPVASAPAPAPVPSGAATTLASIAAMAASLVAAALMM